MAIFNSAGPLLSLAVVTLGLAGCTSTGGGYFEAGSSIDALALSEPAATVIASDMADQIAQNLGQGTTTIALHTDNSAMSVALDARLRAHGFAVTSNIASEDVFAIAYSVSGQSEEIFVRITTPELEMARAYAVTPFGVDPITPISILRRAAS